MCEKNYGLFISVINRIIYINILKSIYYNTISRFKSNVNVPINKLWSLNCTKYVLHFETHSNYIKKNSEGLFKLSNPIASSGLKRVTLRG